MIRVLNLPADPYAAGLLHGQTLASEIRQNLALYQERLEKAYGLARREGLRRARVHLERLAAWAPEYLLGLQGLAQGAGLTPAEIALLDARYELFYAEFAKEGCTALFLRPPKAEEMLLAQTWDWIPSVWGIWVRVPLGDCGVLAFTEAGIFGGKIGLNRAGLGLCLTGLASPGDRWDGEGIPLHARVWRALQALTLAEAVEILSATPSPCSAGFLVGDGEGAACVELTPNEARVFPIPHASFVHANHFLLFSLQAGARAELENSYSRQVRAEALLAAQPSLAVAQVFAVLRDHQGFPNGICRHPDEGLPPWERWATNLAVVLAPRRGEIQFTWGSPCASPVQRLSLTGTPPKGGAAPPA
ncbi:MAG: C45 family peptidase [Candidatus Bipolaricaulota bacterium]|nr:C45 family peptidase [Candidatus Bipolaricaulota bacterium]MDW8127220.1 C45 family peptidase [Candidatus Bipolaricaulota bacterium]